MSIEILAAAPDNLLTTVPTIKKVLGITVADYDLVLNQQVREASDWIENYTGRLFAKQRVLESVVGDGLPDMLLSITPILQIEKVELDDNEYDDYVIYSSQSGIIQRRLGWTTTNMPWNTISPHPSPYAEKGWKITYVGGYVLPSWADDPCESEPAKRTLPYDLERAAIEIVKTNFINRNVDSAMRQYKIGDTMVTWDRAVSAASGAGGMPMAALGILDYWRRAY